MTAKLLKQALKSMEMVIFGSFFLGKKIYNVLELIIKLRSYIQLRFWANAAICGRAEKEQLLNVHQYPAVRLYKSS